MKVYDSNYIEVKEGDYLYCDGAVKLERYRGISDEAFVVKIKNKLFIILQLNGKSEFIPIEKIHDIFESFWVWGNESDEQFMKMLSDRDKEG